MHAACTYSFFLGYSTLKNKYSAGRKSSNIHFYFERIPRIAFFGFSCGYFLQNEIFRDLVQTFDRQCRRMTCFYYWRFEQSWLSYLGKRKRREDHFPKKNLKSSRHIANKLYHLLLYLCQTKGCMRKKCILDIHPYAWAPSVLHKKGSQVLLVSHLDFQKNTTDI